MYRVSGEYTFLKLHIYLYRDCQRDEKGKRERGRESKEVTGTGKGKKKETWEREVFLRGTNLHAHLAQAPFLLSPKKSWANGPATCWPLEIAQDWRLAPQQWTYRLANSLWWGLAQSALLLGPLLVTGRQDNGFSQWFTVGVESERWSG